jgi:predicted nucleic acid-binding Zn ribbon protein
MDTSKQPKTRTCERCGKPFTTTVFWRRWCSNACKQAAKRERERERQEQQQK